MYLGSDFDVQHKFQQAIKDAGFEPPKYIKIGKFQRFPGRGKKSNNTAGWCILNSNGIGAFSDYSTGEKYLWSYNKKHNYNYRTSRPVYSNNREADYSEAALKAQWIWDKCVPTPNNHPYLLKKGIQPHRSRVSDRNQIVLPLRDHRQIMSLQFINPDGSKRFLKGGRKQGSFVYVDGPMEDFNRILICEGWATGCTLAEIDERSLVIAAMDSGNLLAVAISIRFRWSSADVVIAGDDDRNAPSNVGRLKANEAAIAINASVSFPQFPEDAPKDLTDFNDYYSFMKERPYD